MFAYEIRESFGLEHLERVERGNPTPGPFEVLVRLRAVSLNYRDLLTVQGHYNPKQPLPLIPCSDGAGEVVEIGAGVARVREGDRVATLFAQKWISGEPTRDKLRSTLGGPLDGTLAEQIVLPESGVVHAPQGLNDEQVATLPCAALTAWSALVTQASLSPGETVLIQGTGGVSIFALQFAGLLGLRAIVTSSSDEKLERARELGAWQTINYKQTPDWGKKVVELTGGDGVDLVVEVGGAGTLAQSLVALRFGGQISLIGVLAGGAAKLNIVPLLMRNIRLQGILVGHREGFEAMNRAISACKMQPVVDRVFSIDEVHAAFTWLAEGRHLGKICVRL